MADKIKPVTLVACGTCGRGVQPSEGYRDGDHVECRVCYEKAAQRQARENGRKAEVVRTGF